MQNTIWFIFHPFHQNCNSCQLLSFFFPLNYLLHSLTLWSRKRNSTKHFQKEKKRKWERTRFDSLTTDWTHAEPWITSFQHSGRLQVGAFHLAEVMPPHDLSAVAEPSTVVRFLEIPHKFSTIMIALSDLPIFFQHSCTRGCWKP